MHQGKFKNKSKQKVAATTSRDERTKSIGSLEASDLPDKGKGPVETDYGHESQRDVPQHHGGPLSGEDTGLRGDAAIRRAARYGARKHN